MAFNHPAPRILSCLRSVLSASVIASVFAAHASGDPMELIDPGYPDNTQYDGWEAGSLTLAANPGFPGFPGSGDWPDPIGSSAAGSGDAELVKIANGTGGGVYPAGDSIYYGGFSADINNRGGTLAVTDSTPVDDLKSVAFQIQIGEAWGYDFFDGDVEGRPGVPTLSYNGGTQNILADSSTLLEAFYNGTVEMPTGPEDVFINTYLLEWDLSSLEDSITAFEIQWDGVQHAQVYALRLDQTSVVAVATVPEPSSFAWLLGLCPGIAFYVRRRRRRLMGRLSTGETDCPLA